MSGVLARFFLQRQLPVLFLFYIGKLLRQEKERKFKKIEPTQQIKGQDVVEANNTVKPQNLPIAV